MKLTYAFKKIREVARKNATEFMFVCVIVSLSNHLYYVAIGATLMTMTVTFVSFAINAFALIWYSYKPLNNRLVGPVGHRILSVVEFFYSRKAVDHVFRPIISDMREEYFEALSQNRNWKARWVRVRGTWSFFAAMGLDRAFVFVSFFVKAWKSVN